MVQTLSWILGQAAGYQTTNGGWCRGGQRAPFRISRQHIREDIRYLIASERATPREHLEQHATEGPDVSALIDGLAPRLLGTNIGRSAENDAGLSHGRRRNRLRKRSDCARRGR